MAGSKPGREAWLDGLKGLAILLVILGHVLSGYMDARVFPESYVSFYHVRTWIYAFHMPLFFLLSGFTFTLAYWRGGRLRAAGFFQQLFNLLWIYVLFALIQWGVKQAVPDMVNEVYDLDTLRRMFVEPLGNFWYIYVLFVIYLIAALTNTPAWSMRWLLLPLSLSVWAVDTHLNWQNLTVYRVVYHFFFFALGCALCRRRRLVVSRKALGMGVMGLCTAVYFYVFWYTRNWYGVWKVGIALSVSYGLLQLFRRCRPLAEFPLLQLCGKHCLEIYLLHTFFTAGLRNYLPEWGVSGPWLSVLLNFVLSTAACLGLSFLAGKARWTDLLFRPCRLFRRLAAKRKKA